MTALQVAQQIEKQLDAQLNELSNLQEDDIAELRRRRIQQLQDKDKQIQRWRQLGHGTYSEISDQKEWFDATKNSERVVCHFYRSATWRCEIVDKHLTKLSAKHIETRFIKINAENTPFLAERLNIVVLPCIVMSVSNVSVGMFEGFDEFGGRDDFATSVLEKKLSERGVIELQDEQHHPSANGSITKSSVGNSIRKGNQKQTNIAGTLLLLVLKVF
jgi:hypothetical protein